MKQLVLLLLTVIITAVAGTTSPCDQLHLAASYDVIVVGTGLGGSVAARRLAEWNPNWNILVVERGNSAASCPECASSANQPGAIADPNSGGFINTTAQPGVNNQKVSIKDAAIQGGATAVNGFYNVRGDVVRLFDDYFPPNWNALSMIPFYERYENYTFPPGFHKGYPWTYASELRGNMGPVQVTQESAATRQNISTRFLNALQNEYPNMPISYDTSVNDGFFPGIGSSYVETTTNGPLRVTAYTAYIQPYTGTNLKAIYGTLATKIVFDSSAEVTGVQLMLTPSMAAQLGLGNKTLTQCVVSTAKVVVSSGALGTPKLLQLSGVGPAPLLTQFGIPVVSNVPGVGQNFRDHFTIFTFLAPKNATSNPVPYNTNSTNDYGWAFYNANDTQGVPNDFIYGFQAFSPTNMIFTTAGSNLRSSGTVNIASTDPTVPPAVNPNYFKDPADRYAIGLAAMKSFNISNALGLVQVANPCATYPCQTPQQTLQAFINYGLLSPGYHFSATASLCNVTNPVSLRVAGTRGLYVLDASIMPYSPPSNTQSTIYAVSERGIDQINANMHSTYALQDIEEAAGWLICLLAPNVAAIQ